MSIHVLPAGIDADTLRARLTRQLRAPSGIRYADLGSTPVAVEFTPDLSGSEQTTLASLLTSATSQVSAPTRLRAQYLTLRQWAIDAQATYDAATTANRALTAAEQREFIRRMGKLLDGMADLLLNLSLDS